MKWSGESQIPNGYRTHPCLLRSGNSRRVIMFSFWLARTNEHASHSLWALTGRIRRADARWGPVLEGGRQPIEAAK